MDRETTNVAKTQTGFIDFVIRPVFQVSSQLIPKITKNMEQLDINKFNWNERCDEYEEKMKNKNKENDKLALTSATGVADPTKMDRPTVENLQNQDPVFTELGDLDSSIESGASALNLSATKSLPPKPIVGTLDVIGEED